VSPSLEICPVCAFRGALEQERETREFKLDPIPSPSEVRFGHYELAQREDGTPLELGRGGMGVTYKATDINLQCPVALKVISARLIGDESARRRFVREARAAASVRHQNVASVFHLGRHGDSYFYAMEFVAGETLAKMIRKAGALEPSVALKVTALIAAGLEGIDKQNLVHRDIKPGNIMIGLHEDEIETVKIIDLGLTKKVAEAGDSASGESTQGVFVGTPAYASPEQFIGLEIDIRSDLYSLGVTLWEMLTGQVPFNGTPNELMQLHRTASIPLEKLGGIPQAVRDLLQTLLEKGPSQRFQSPTQLVNILGEVMESAASRREPTLGGSRLSRRVDEQYQARTSTENVIAVLPFETLGVADDDNYFADGIHDEILTSLAKIKRLRVIGRTSVMHFRDHQSRDLRKIGGALGAAKIMEGTFRKDRNRMRLNLRLIEAQTAATIWADGFNGSLKDIFAIQSEVAKQVASKLRARITAEERRRLEEMPTKDTEALDLYLQAKALILSSAIYSAGGEAELKAVQLLDRVTRKDRKFVLAYCLLTKAHDYLYYSGSDKSSERLRLADSAIDVARSLRADLPEVHIAEAFHRYICYRDYEAARSHLAAAAQLRPEDAETLLMKAAMDRRQGYWDRSCNVQKSALTLDPRNPECFRQLAFNCFFLRRYEAFEEAMASLIHLEPARAVLKVERAYSALAARANLIPLSKALKALPSGRKDDPFVVMLRFSSAVLSRNWLKAEKVLNETTSGEFDFARFPSLPTLIPLECMRVWTARLRGIDPSGEPQTAPACRKLERKVQANPDDAYLLSTLAIMEAVCSRKEQALAHATRAAEMFPVSRDAVEGPGIARNVAIVYTLNNQADLAIKELAILADLPNGVDYGDLKLHPCWDPLRSDPRFEKLVAELAPRTGYP
jgi:serine/threonine protein kinase/tetratricopeptide (TPR) repeat protein